ncbi:hypothetical protein C2G38_2230356 [Gigaspora rosea]|uniref:Uncharacterized protein n=1 Tax=Gigaspora rosea TaxID=44941 RepID=A0A397TTZ7_9GLOM|nr:hypothetical protein C2G38_2230356 [Gigaspora rosea]
MGQSDISNDFGSGIDGKQLKQVMCVNVNITNCFTCKNISDKQQRMSKGALERMPTFFSDSPSMPFFNPLKKVEYLWGNMPAIDIIKIDSNEFMNGKSSFNKPINLLFAASRDLNDTIISMNGLPII